MAIDRSKLRDGPIVIESESIDSEDTEKLANIILDIWGQSPVKFYDTLFELGQNFLIN